MNTATITYTLEYFIIFAPEYKFTSKGELFNSKTNRKMKLCLNSGSIGYYLNGKFYSMTKIRKHTAKIKNEYCPF